MGGGKDADYTNCSDMVSTKYFNKSKRIFIIHLDAVTSVDAGSTGGSVLVFQLPDPASRYSTRSLAPGTPRHRYCRWLPAITPQILYPPLHS
eukprot:8043716-Pyramimonas_sp.AAC.1